MLQNTEQFIVSARKYRPEGFGSLIGQESIAATLKNSIRRGQIAHAYLFCGPRGVGKTTTARIFAKSINCLDPTPDMEPCGECESCRSFNEGRSYCIHELDAASNNSVDDIRNLIDIVRIPPQVGKYAVFIIDEVHMLSSSAFNAFLKTLEEPPSYAVFILATTEKHKVLPTVLSRCQTYDFNRISIPDIVHNLRDIADKEGVTIDDGTLHILAMKADGAMRDALTLFDQSVAFCGKEVKAADVKRNLNVLDDDYYFAVIDDSLAGDYIASMKVFDEVLAKGFNALHFVSGLSSHIRNLMVSINGAGDTLLHAPDTLKARYSEQSARCTVKYLYGALGVTTACEAQYRQSGNQRLLIEFALMKLALGSQESAAASAASAAMPGPAAAPQKVPAATPRAEIHPIASAQDPEAAAPAPASASAPAATPRAESPSIASAQDPEAAASAPASAPQQPAHKPAAVSPAAGPGVSLKGMFRSLEGGTTGKMSPAEDKPYTLESFMTVWKELAESERAAGRNGIAALMNCYAPKVDVEADTVVFYVSNDVQLAAMDERKVAVRIEGELRRRLQNMSLVMTSEIFPELLNEKRERTPYSDSEKASYLLNKYEELRKLKDDLQLDTK